MLVEMRRGVGLAAFLVANGQKATVRACAGGVSNMWKPSFASTGAASMEGSAGFVVLITASQMRLSMGKRKRDHNHRL